MDFKDLKLHFSDCGAASFRNDKGTSLAAINLGVIIDSNGISNSIYIPEIFKDARAIIPNSNNDKLPYFQDKVNRDIVCLLIYADKHRFKDDIELIVQLEEAKGNIIILSIIDNTIGSINELVMDKIKMSNKILALFENKDDDFNTKEFEYAKELNKTITVLTSRNTPDIESKPAKETEEKNRGFKFEPHNLSREEIVDVLFYKAKEFYKTEEIQCLLLWL